MIVQRNTRPDRTSEVALYLTSGQLDDVNMARMSNGEATLAELDEQDARDWCRRILDLSAQDTMPRRLVVSVDENVRLDSEELGHDLVKRFSPELDEDSFNPDYSSVDFTVSVLDAEGERTYSELLASGGELDPSRVERALQCAKVVVSFSFNPPSLA